MTFEPDKGGFNNIRYIFMFYQYDVCALAWPVCWRVCSFGHENADTVVLCCQKGRPT